ncbi:MAG: hydrogenobyrinic acid a,c-diamide synthase (glutamine-hydrolyzing) [Candidatus Latescibacterota bacterium]|nr:MAG: hydrogenobyrinic acid a,c-diamide synthase (glutamine-hydrolyzing) [Candidatus Latescibacterota bacterium]
MATNVSRIVIAGMSGDSGKTIVSLGFLTALRQRGFSVSVFKKGPDYIDPAWLSEAAGTACRNLDTFMVEPAIVSQRFVSHAGDTDIAVIEGNRGIFDGRDAEGTHSTAELAKLLGAPVVLVVNATKTTRTVAAVVKGCIEFDHDVNIAGVVLNRVAGKRHLAVISESIEAYCGVSVLGAIPRLGDNAALIPGRHLGLVTPAEFESGETLENRLRDIAEDHLDIDAIIDIARDAGPVDVETVAEIRNGKRGKTKVGYFKDTVFTFYYPENLEALEKHGARLIPISSLSDQKLPDIDALYIGGGFPETHAEQLARNRSMMASVKKAAADGLPIYAECGGLIYLARSLHWNENVYPMVGVFPVDLEMHRRPAGHGYSITRVDTQNPFYPVGTSIRGHEFHYSAPIGGGENLASCMTVDTGVGLGESRDGIFSGNTLACYTHIHSDGVPDWAPSLVSKAAAYAANRNNRAA